MSIETNSAFPWFTPEGYYNGSVHAPGMTLRDYFAAAALQGLLTKKEFSGTPEEYATVAFAYAGAMLKEHSK